MPPTELALDYEALRIALGQREAAGPLGDEALGYLRSAFELDRPDLFASWVRWRAQLEEQRSDVGDAIGPVLDALQALEPQHSAEARERWRALVEGGRRALGSSTTASARSPFGNHSEAELAQRYLQQLLDGQRREATQEILAAVEAGLPIRTLYTDVFQPVLAEIGRLWETGRLSVGQEHYCTAVTQSIMAQLYPRISNEKRQGRSLVATSVAGNLHEIGVRMVADLFELEGWDTWFLGADTPDADVIESVRKDSADVLALSVMLSAQLPAAARMIRALRDASDCDRVRVLVGGQGFGGEERLASEIGADGWAADAITSLRVASALAERP